MADDQGEKQFDATPQRIEQFRKEGRFARARDAGGAAAIGGALIMLALSSSAAGYALRELFERTMGHADDIMRGHWRGAAHAAVNAALLTMGPLVGAATLLSVAIGFAQAGVRFDTDLLSFKPERLNPLGKLKELLSPKHALVETGMALLRVGAIGYVAYRAVWAELPMLSALAGMPLDRGLTELQSGCVRVLTALLVATVAVAALDFVQSKIRLDNEMKMSRQEMIDEAKSQDGDAKMKARMRQRGRAMLRKRSLRNVKEADVIVTNPTHISVALRYSDEDVAPIVVAKGHDDFAMAIRREARKHNIPIMENKPLARALDARCEIGDTIPFEHFAAVAKVLAFVYRLKRRGTPSA